MLTGSGRAVALAGVGLLAAGTLLRWYELLALGVACLLAVVAALWWLLRRTELVACREIIPVRVAEGERAVAAVTVTNTGSRRSPPLTATEQVGGHRVGVRLPSLARGATTTARYDLPTGRRGMYRVGPLTMARADPLRLVDVAHRHGGRSLLCVHPRVHAVDAAPIGRAQDRDGPSSQAAPQGGIAFHSLRGYVPGDDLRLIHWRSTARTGTLMVRHNVVPNEPRVMVVLDTSSGPYTETSFEEAVRVAASVGVAAASAGYPLRVVTTGGATASAESGQDGPGAVLDLLAGVEPSPDDPGLAATALLAGDDGMSLLVVTGAAPPGQLGAVAAVRGRYDMVTVVRVGAGPTGASTGAGVFVIDCATSAAFARVWNRGGGR